MTVSKYQMQAIERASIDHETAWKTVQVHLTFMQLGPGDFHPGQVQKFQDEQRAAFQRRAKYLLMHDAMIP